MSENGDVPRTTTDSGIPAPSDEFSLTAGPNGPTLLQDHYLVQKMQHFNRERVPERVVHARGSGAHGFFEVTEDVSPWTSAKLFSEVGKRTPMFARFSTVAGEMGSPDTVRDPRGFALKFYTEDGNYDLVGNDTPTFFVRDAAKFEDFIHSQKRMPDTGLKSNDAQWDFWTLSPETAHQVTVLMSDRGTPRTLRNMNGYSSHTYSWVNANGDALLGQVPLQDGPGNRELHGRRGRRDGCHGPGFPSPRPVGRDRRGRRAGSGAWRCRSCPSRRPRTTASTRSTSRRSGRTPTTRRSRSAGWCSTAIPANHFAEVDQAGFAPARLVPGIGLSPDKMLMGRIFSYHDTHLHRIGANYEQLPINAPKVPVHSYNKDGAMTYRHAGTQPVYAPNSYGGPKADPSTELPTWWVEAGEIGRYAYEKHADDDDSVQPRALYRDVMDDTDREHLATNIVGHASNDVSDDVQRRVIQYWTNVDADLGARVAAGLRKTDVSGNGSGTSADIAVTGGGA